MCDIIFMVCMCNIVVIYTIFGEWFAPLNTRCGSICPVPLVRFFCSPQWATPPQHHCGYCSCSPELVLRLFSSRIIGQRCQNHRCFWLSIGIYFAQFLFPGTKGPNITTPTFNRTKGYHLGVFYNISPVGSQLRVPDRGGGVAAAGQGPVLPWALRRQCCMRERGFSVQYYFSNAQPTRFHIATMQTHPEFFIFEIFLCQSFLYQAMCCVFKYF